MRYCLSLCHLYFWRKSKKYNKNQKSEIEGYMEFWLTLYIHCIVLILDHSFRNIALKRFDREPLKLHKQMIPHFSALDVSIKICQAQVCSSIRGCHATYLVKNTFFKGEVAWQRLKELQSCSSSILVLTTRAFKWGIVCLSIIIACGEIKGNVKKCQFYVVKINTFWHYH